LNHKGTDFQDQNHLAVNRPSQRFACAEEGNLQLPVVKILSTVPVQFYNIFASCMYLKNSKKQISKNYCVS
jgi:hypothetical protein